MRTHLCLFSCILFLLLALACASHTYAQGPTAPVGLKIYASDGKAGLSWQAVSGAASYNLYRAAAPGAEGNTPFLTGISSIPYVDTGLTNGVPYFYQVTAVNDSGESAKSQEVFATPQPAPTLTQAQAVQIAQTFCQTIGAPVTDAATAIYPAPKRHPSQQETYWQPRWLVRLGSKAEVEVVDATGHVSRYYNFDLSRQALAANQPAGTPMAQSDALAKATAALQAAGTPADIGTASAQNFQLTSPPTSAGDLWTVTWPRQLGGVPYRHQQVTVMLQAETGAVQALSVSFPAPPPTATTMTVTSDQATQAAQGQLSTVGVSGATVQSVTAQIVQPNTYWQANGSAAPFPNSAGQAAWNAMLTDANGRIYEVWVDGNSGAVIGGESYGLAGKRGKAPLVPPAKPKGGKRK